MTYTNIVGRVLFCVFAVASLAQCKGGKNKAAGATIKITPQEPIVITADIKVNGTQTVAAPWFSFQVEIENDTEYPFEIVALKAEITGQDASGLSVTREEAWAPSEHDYTLDTLQCTYGSFGRWAVGDKKKLSIAGTGGCNSGSVLFYSDGNPSGPRGTSYRYRVKLTPLGYFIDENGDPDDRFQKFKMFYTK